MNIDLYMKFRELTGYEIVKSNNNNIMWVLFKGDDLSTHDNYNSAMRACLDHHEKQHKDKRQDLRDRYIASIDREIAAHEASLLVISLKIAELKEKKERAQDIYDLAGSLISLEDCELSVRTANCLENAGFNYLEDVLFFYKEKGDSGLLKLKNFGRRSLNEIKDILKEHALL
jgi:hypothetical protein